MEEIIKDTEEISERPIEVITEEINFYKNTAGGAILEIGKRLNEAKAMLSHGEWGKWLSEKVDFSEATAQRFMRLAKEYPNPSPVMDLGASKALLLLALPESEREEFTAEKHLVDGAKKTVSEMSKRELEKAIREKKEAENTIEQLRCDLKSAEESQEETDALLEMAKEEIEQLKKTLEERPAVSDEQATNIKKEAEAEVQKKIDALNKKIDKLKEEKERAEFEKKNIEDKIEAVKNDYEKIINTDEQQKQMLEAEIDKLKAKIKMSSSFAVVKFQEHFNSVQSEVNKMIEIMSDEQDEETIKTLKTALKKLGEQIANI